MTLSSADPNQLFEQSYVEDYKRQKRIMYRRVGWHLDRMHLVSTIARFPFQTLYKGTPLPFWKTVYRALFDSAVLGIWRLALDNREDGLCVTKWKSLMCTNAKDVGDRKEIGNAYKQLKMGDVSYTSKKEELRSTFGEYRHHKVGHFKRGLLDGSVSEIQSEALPVTDLEVMTALIEKAYHLLALGSRPAGPVTFYKEKPRYAHWNQEDVDEMLDDLAYGSDLMHYPEFSDAALKIVQRTAKEHGDEEAYNHYRKRLELEPIPFPDEPTFASGE